MKSDPKPHRMRFGSLFSGIGGFDRGFELAGLKCAWQVEIDRDCRRVLKRHWPNVELCEDVRSVEKLEPVDVICGGFPCQDLSVAGKRKGLAGERSGLWFEFLRVIECNRPRWVVIENVPGLFSSDGGDDLAVILDGLESAGYVFDLDVLDAQFHGVAQRRRRLFIVCQLAESILKKKTISSALTIAQCLTENLLLVLIAARSPLAINSDDLTFDAGEPNRSLRQRMTLFGMLKDGAAETLAENLAALPQSCDCEREGLESNHGKSTQEGSRTSRATKCRVSTRVTDTPAECQSTEQSWNPTLADCLQVMSESITSTQSSEITESKIYSCALLTLYIAERTILSPRSCPTFWSAALSTLTALKAFIEYARQTSSSLFTEAIWLQPWRDFIGQAVSVCESLGRVGIGSFEQVFPLSEGLPGDSPPRREAGARVADPITRSFAKHHGRTVGNNGGCQNMIAATLDQRGRGPTDSVMMNLQVSGAVSSKWAKGTGGPAGDEAYNLVSMPLKAKANSSHDESHETYITHALRPDDNDAQANHLIATAFAENQRGEVRMSDISPQLSCSGGKPGSGYPAVAFTERTRAEGRNFESQEELAYTVTNPGSGGRTHSRQIAGSFGVRRLTPTERERLQAFPDGWTAVDHEGRAISDSARYRMLGNAVCVNVAQWIGKQIIVHS